VSEKLDAYAFNDAAMALYQFVWNDFCDWYVEIVKSRLTAHNDPSAPVARGTLARVLSDSLALLHPFTPYMSEVLWASLNETLGRKQPLLMNCKWPDGRGLALDEEAESQMQTIQDLVHAVRQVRNLTTAGDRQMLAAKIAAPRKAEREVLLTHVDTVRALAYLEACDIETQVVRPPNSAVAVAGGLEVFVALGANVDLGKLKDVLARRAEKVRAGIASIDAKLANAAFVERADPEVVEGEKSRRAEMVTELKLLERNLSDA
jgi:valyl-tRNA synthetase